MNVQPLSPKQRCDAGVRGGHDISAVLLQKVRMLFASVSSKAVEARSRTASGKPEARATTPSGCATLTAQATEFIAMAQVLMDKASKPQIRIYSNYMLPVSLSLRSRTSWCTNCLGLLSW